MKGKKSTRSAFLTSLMSLVLCFAMLLGTTFAWFTDTASTAVNKIQAGNLDVQLLAEDRVTSLEGKTLAWQKATGHEDDSVLWEPGCTYSLQPIVIKNNGDLNLKYKIIISGINGSAKLNQAIEWTIQEKDANDVVLTTALDADHTLAPNASNMLTISGHMREDAGNEYQGLFIDNIGITVVATQQTGEYDSISDIYDQNAVYPVAPELSNTTVSGTITSAGVTLGNMSDTASPTAAQITIPADAVTGDTNAVFSMELDEVKPDSVTYEISLKQEGTNDSVTLAAPATVTTNIGAGLTIVAVKHSGAEMTKVTSTSRLTDGTYYYSKTTGKLLICTSTFSPFEISYEFDGKASVNGVAYTTVSNAIAAANEGDTVVLMKDVSNNLTVNKNITLDLNGHTMEGFILSYNQVVTIQGGCTVTIKNGTISWDKSAFYLKGGNNNVTLQNVTIDCGFIGVWSDSAENTVKIEDSKITSKYIGVYQNGSYGGNSFTIRNTNITDTYGLGVYISNSVNNAKQDLTIDGCTIAGPSGVEIKHTNATITDSTLIGTATPTASGSNGNGSCTDGYALAVTTNGETDYVTGTVTVNGTKFYSGTAEDDPNGYVFVYQVADGASVTINGTAVSDYNTYGGETTLSWEDKLKADWAALREENSTITLEGEFVLSEDLVLEWPDDAVKSITLNGGEGLSITGDGSLCIKYPASDPNGDSHDISLGGSACSYFSKISIG